MHREREHDGRAGDPAHSEKQRRGNEEAPHDRNLRVDGAELEFQGEPGRAPDEHGSGIKPEIDGGEPAGGGCPAGDGSHFKPEISGAVCALRAKASSQTF